MSSLEVIEVLCRIIEECLAAIEDEAIHRELEAEYLKAIGE